MWVAEGVQPRRKGAWSGIWMVPRPVKPLVLGYIGGTQEGSVASFLCSTPQWYGLKIYAIKACVMENIENGYTDTNICIKGLHFLRQRATSLIMGWFVSCVWKNGSKRVWLCTFYNMHTVYKCGCRLHDTTWSAAGWRPVTYMLSNRQAAIQALTVSR
jgi:hypothetical protein